MEPLDLMVGHTPGAINHCWKENLAKNGYFPDSGQLQKQFSQIYADTLAEQVVFYCGLGVSAASLYTDSWSEWCEDVARLNATDPEQA